MWKIQGSKVVQKMKIEFSRPKFSFNIASEASYVYNLSWQKFAKNGKYSDFLKKTEACGETALPDR